MQLSPNWTDKLENVRLLCLIPPQWNPFLTPKVPVQNQLTISLKPLSSNLLQVNFSNFFKCLFQYFHRLPHTLKLFADYYLITSSPPPIILMNYASVYTRTNIFISCFYVCFLYLFCLCSLCGWGICAAKWCFLFLKLGKGHLLFDDILPVWYVWSWYCAMAGQHR